MKPAPKETVVEEDHSEEDMDSGSDGFDDMGEIPLDVTHAAGSPAPASVPNTVTLDLSHSRSYQPLTYIHLFHRPPLRKVHLHRQLPLNLNVPIL